MTVKTVGRILIDVRQEDINSGRRTSPSGCPFALAINRVYGQRVASVGLSYAALFIPGRQGFEYGLSLSKESTDWISNFDSSEPVKPIRVWADLVELEIAA